MNKTNNILICPLEWGLGHAARMIPMARELREMNNNIIIGGGDEQLSLFRNELSGLTCIHFPGFKPGYSRFLPQYIPLLLKTPVLLYHIIREHQRLKSIIREYDIDIVISDNRFGLWNRKIKTVYITHMPLVPFPKFLRSLEFIGIAFHRAIIRKYSFCFIPDLPGKLNVSGRLSHGMKLPGNVRYIGILSRFLYVKPKLNDNSGIFQHNTVILSGPEPQKGILKQKMTELLKDKTPITIMLEGRPGTKSEIVCVGNITIYSHLPSQEMREILTGSQLIIARPGYTTLMELISLNCSALLIPTPGQTEQEYLAEYLSEKGWFAFIRQSDLKEEIQLSVKEHISAGEITEQSRIFLSIALKELLEKPHPKFPSSILQQEY